MKGSLTQRKNGYWYVHVHPRVGDGWRTKTIATGVKSKPGAKKAPPEAEAAYVRAMARYELGGHRVQPRSGARITVTDWMQRWLDTRRARNLDTSTLRQYTDVVRLYIVGPDDAPILGGLPLSGVTEDVVSKWLAQLLVTPNTRSVDPKPLSPTTVRIAYSIFRSALDLAVPDHILVNPFARVPKPKAREFDAAWLEVDQAAALLRAAAGTRLEALWVLQLATGMRIGELLSLGWRDVDLTGGTVRVRDAKTSAGDRVLSIADDDGAGPVLDALRVHRLRQAEKRLAAGASLKAGDLVFASDSGRPLLRSNLLRREWVPEERLSPRFDRAALETRTCTEDGHAVVEYRVPVGDWARLLHAAGLPWMRPHDLRHTAGTMALAQGAPLKAVQQMLGHRSEAFMLRRYAHAMEGDRARVGALMAGVVKGLAPAEGERSAHCPRIEGKEKARASARARG